MSFACQILASYLLMFSFSTRGEAPVQKTVHGTLGRDINLDILNSQKDDKFADIRWGKNGARILQWQPGNNADQQTHKYEILKNGTLKIKHLERNDNNSNYKVDVYDPNGKNIFEGYFSLMIQEAVSKPKISWDCIKTTLNCEVKNGTDYKLRLYLNGTNIIESSKKIVYNWSNSILSEPFKCTAINQVSEESSMVDIITCPGKVDIYLIVGVCVGGIIFFIFVALLILYISKRKIQPRRRNGEGMGISTHTITSEERSRKLHQIPGSTPQTPAASQPPPPPGHRTQAPGHRPPPPGHRVHHQQQKRPPPPLGTQSHQQKGPPLPRPRVQPKPPRGATENS